MSMNQDELTRSETLSLISSDKVEGTEVYNPAGDHLGTVQKVMIDKHSGRVSYAVMSFGGFLGLGEDYHPLPWDVLNYDPDRGGYVVNLDKQKLEGAPRYDPDDEPDWSDKQYGHRVHDYYGVPPYWGMV